MPPLKTKQQLAKEQKASNARERQIAKQYLQAGPSISNLYNAFTHWYNSVPFLGGQPETGNEYITGHAPAAGVNNFQKLVRTARVAREFNRTVSNGVKTFSNKTPTPVVRTVISKKNETPKVSLKFLERPVKINWSEKSGLPKEVRNRRVPEYTLDDARHDAKLFAEKWGYKFPENASLRQVEDLYNRHNTLFRGVTTEGLEQTRADVSRALGIDPSQLTAQLYLQYASTHPWTPQQRIWVTPDANYGGFYSAGGLLYTPEYLGQVSAVMRPWKTTKNIKLWPKQAEWRLGFKEEQEPIIAPWVSGERGAIIDNGMQREMLANGPLLYRGLAKDFEGTNNIAILYPQAETGYFQQSWLDGQLSPLPNEIYIPPLP